MKKNLLMILAFVVIAVLIACENNAQPISVDPEVTLNVDLKNTEPGSTNGQDQSQFEYWKIGTVTGIPDGTEVTLEQYELTPEGDEHSGLQAKGTNTGNGIALIIENGKLKLGLNIGGTKIGTWLTQIASIDGGVTFSATLTFTVNDTEYTEHVTVTIIATNPYTSGEST